MNCVRPIVGCAVALGLSLGIALSGAPAAAAPEKKVPSVHSCSQSEADAGLCVRTPHPVSALGPSVSCRDAPRGFNLYGPPRPFGPVVRLCW